MKTVHIWQPSSPTPHDSAGTQTLDEVQANKLYSAFNDAGRRHYSFLSLGHVAAGIQRRKPSCQAVASLLCWVQSRLFSDDGGALEYSVWRNYSKCGSADTFYSFLSRRTTTTQYLDVNTLYSFRTAPFRNKMKQFNLGRRVLYISLLYFFLYFIYWYFKLLKTFEITTQLFTLHWLLSEMSCHSFGTNDGCFERVARLVASETPAELRLCLLQSAALLCSFSLFSFIKS